MRQSGDDEFQAKRPDFYDSFNERRTHDNYGQKINWNALGGPRTPNVFDDIFRDAGGRDSSPSLSSEASYGGGGGGLGALVMVCLAAVVLLPVLAVLFSLFVFVAKLTLSLALPSLAAATAFLLGVPVPGTRDARGVITDPFRAATVAGATTFVLALPFLLCLRPLLTGASFDLSQVALTLALAAAWFAATLFVTGKVYRLQLRQRATWIALGRPAALGVVAAALVRVRIEPLTLPAAFAPVFSTLLAALVVGTPLIVVARLQLGPPLRGAKREASARLARYVYGDALASAAAAGTVLAVLPHASPLWLKCVASFIAWLALACLLQVHLAEPSVIGQRSRSAVRGPGAIARHALIGILASSAVFITSRDKQAQHTPRAAQPAVVVKFEAPDQPAKLPAAIQAFNQEQARRFTESTGDRWRVTAPYACAHHDARETSSHMLCALKGTLLHGSSYGDGWVRVSGQDLEKETGRLLWPRNWFVRTAELTKEPAKSKRPKSR